MKAQIIFRYVDAMNSLGLAAVHCLKFYSNQSIFVSVVQENKGVVFS